MEKTRTDTPSEKRRVRRTFAMILGALLLVSACAVIPVAAVTWDVTVIFVGNGDVDKSTVPAPITVEDLEYITLPPGPTWEGHTFRGWGETTQGKAVGQAGDRFKVSGGAFENLTLYALWVPKVTVTFDGNGDGVTSPKPITVDEDTYITLPTPTRDGYTFRVWAYNRIGGGDEYKAGERLKVWKSITLYAIWEKEKTKTTPTATKTTTPTVTKTTAPTQVPSSYDTPVSTPRPSTPVPLFGILAGLGAAAVLGIAIKRK